MAFSDKFHFSATRERERERTGKQCHHFPRVIFFGYAFAAAEAISVV
jgi:hypothetical protein